MTITRRQVGRFLDGLGQAFDMAPPASLRVKYAIQQAPLERVADAFALAGKSINDAMLRCTEATPAVQNGADSTRRR